MSVPDFDLAAKLAPLLRHLANQCEKLAGSSGESLALFAETEGCHDVDAAATRPRKIMTNSTLLTARQVGELLQLDARTVRRRWREGSIPGAIQVGKSVRWRRRDIERWIEEQAAR
jgi:excisionase family DNA binding protein